MPRILMTGASGGIGTSLAQAAAADLSGPAAERPEGARRPRRKRKIQGSRAVRSRAGRGDLRRRRRHPAFRRIFGRRSLGQYPAVQHHRLLQPVRGRAQEGRQAHRVCVIEPCGRLLSAPPPDRNRRDGAPRQPLRRQQGVRRSGRRALCRQAWAQGDLPAHRQFRRQAARSSPALDLAEAGRPGAARAASGSIIPTSISRFSTARRTTSARGGTITAPTTSAIARPAAPRTFASTRLPSRRNCRPTPSAISTRAARSAAWSSTVT